MHSFCNKIKATYRGKLLLQKFLEAHRLPELNFIPVFFVLVVVETILGVGVGGGVRVGGQGVGWEEE